MTRQSAAPLLSVQSLTVTYPGMRVPALKDLSLDLITGEKLAVIGESGSGKSTLARAIAGLLPRSSKTFGRVETPLGPLKAGRDIGYVFQDPGASLDPLISIGAHLSEVLRTHLPLSRPDALARAEELLGRVQIPEPQKALRAYPHQFSGGQRQRIAIALAIAAQPKLLIADEATSALDVLVQAEIAELLNRLASDTGMTLLFITHDMALASTLADRIAVLNQAQLVEIGPARQVIDTPRAEYTRRLLAANVDLTSPRLVGESSILPTQTATDSCVAPTTSPLRSPIPQRPAAKDGDRFSAPSAPQSSGSSQAGAEASTQTQSAASPPMPTETPLPQGPSESLSPSQNFSEPDGSQKTVRE